MSELMKAKLHLAEQDRDSWKANFITARDAASKHDMIVAREALAKYEESQK